MEIAVYGKGGIGKSTVSANLSAALVQKGRRILQIGCDPKHDSTRLLLHGKDAVTVLDYLRQDPKLQKDPSAVLTEGYLGVGCIEAGGPRPGIGCAGRGIISAFEFLEKFKIKQNYDTILYDVLGDVVCGGFAVPVRREYADVIFLVTSGEYMSLYAANNILRGIRNFDGERYRRVAGIIYNERRLADEDGRVKRFADAVGLPVCVKVPRSEAFALAEEKRMPLMELPGCEAEKSVFLQLAEMVCDDMTLYRACPLTDDRLEEVIIGKSIHPVQTAEIAADKDAETPDRMNGSFAALTGEYPVPSMRKPLYGCAFNGAATTAIHLTDAAVIAHGPRACAFYTLQNITSPGRKNLFNRGILMPSALQPNFESTDLGHAEAVFGGMELLKEKVRQAIAKRPGSVVIVSSCTSGIIGDDIRQAEELSENGIPVITISADGVAAGDYMEGIRMCMHTLADRLIDRTIKPTGRLVNIINETGVSNNISVNYQIVETLLHQLDVEVNCRFLGDTTTAQLQNFLAAPLNLLASESEDSLSLKEKFISDYGCRFLDAPFPVGFDAASRWVTKLGDFFDRTKASREIIEKERLFYHTELEKLQKRLSGKKLLLTTINANLDWLLGAAVLSGMEIVWIGVLNYLRQELNVTNHPEYCADISPDFTPEMVRQKVAEYAPDLVVTNYTQTLKEGSFLQDAIPMTPVAGFHSALYVLRRWADLFETREEGNWSHDRVWFETYYS